jgi:hypothetical protein
VSDGTISCGCGRVTGLPDRKTSIVRDGVEHRHGKLCRPAPRREHPETGCTTGECGRCGGVHCCSHIDQETFVPLDCPNKAPGAGFFVAVPERAGREGDQALPVEGEGDILEEIRERLRKRREYGIAHYGKPLQAFNGRDAFRDAEEELLDQYAYMAQARAEFRSVVEALKALARYVRTGKPTQASDAAVKLAEKLEVSRV